MLKFIVEFNKNTSSVLSEKRYFLRYDEIIFFLKNY